jgi:hypothetical protein
LNKEHPITPPPELVQQWWDGTHGAFYEFEAVTTQAARWGAEQELEACCEWVSQFNYDDYSYQERLRAARRRPKPPSLKEQALKALDSFEGFTGSLEEVDIIRRALESLPE